MGGPRRMHEAIAQTEAALSRAVGYVGTFGAGADGFAAVEHLHAAHRAGPHEAVLEALIGVGALQRLPAGFWREVERAALVLPQYSPAIGPAERVRRAEFHARLQRLG